jgi:hypothetical protein
MTDKTTAEAKAARAHAASYSARGAELLLDMSSNEEDTSPSWHQVWIFIYPRNLLPKLDDGAAEERMNNALVGPKAIPTGATLRTMLAGQSFMESEFQLKEPPLTKHAKVYTTLCKGQLVSFAFVSNSSAQLTTMEDSLKALDISTH